MHAVLVLAVLACSALAAEVPAESHIMQVPRAPPTLAPQQQAMPGAQPGPDADDRSFKVLAAVPLLAKVGLKPKFPFGLKEKLPLGLKKKLPAFLGGASAAASGAASASGAAGSLGALGLHGLDFGKLGGDAALLHQYPIWKVHRYNGIDLRPVRLGVPAGIAPAPAAGPYPAAIVEEPKQVYGPPPKEIAVPEPVYGPPAETYGPPAETYGPPAETYGPPAETYGPPAETYGVPAGAPAAADGDTQESLEALSQLGALTDFLPSGGSSSGGALAGLGSLGTLLSTSGRSKGEILSTLAKLKQGFPDLIRHAVQPAAAPAPPPAESAVYHPPTPTGIHGLFQRHPLFSAFGGAAADHVALPPLPELPGLPEIKGLKEIPGIPKLPLITLPTKYVAQGGPYVSVRYPTVHNQQQAVIAPRNPVPAPAPVSSYAPPANAYGTPAAPAVEIPAVPAASVLPPVHPADTYAQPSQVGSVVGPENAIQQVTVPSGGFALPLEQQSQQTTQFAATAATAGPSGTATQVTAMRGQLVNSYGQPVSQETYTYTSHPQQQQYSTPVQQYSAPVQQYAAPAQQYAIPVQQYAAPVQQYSAPVQQYSAPVQQYTAPAQQYSAPVTQYSAPQFASDAFTSASESRPTQLEALQGREEQAVADGEMPNDDEDEERVQLNPNSRSDHIDAAASEASEVRVALPSGHTRVAGQLAQTPAVTPVFDRDEQARRLEQMQQMVDQMMDLSAYLDPAHPAATSPAAASSGQTKQAAESTPGSSAPSSAAQQDASRA